ncbi:MAG: hypothetical protein HY983_01555 [Candidatus Magasanikbacteria bacterium]|nr:hypothetical protein [Candidatus Magasanikbacteria bacterium]
MFTIKTLIVGSLLILGGAAIWFISPLSSPFRPAPKDALPYATSSPAVGRPAAVVGGNFDLKIESDFSWNDNSFRATASGVIPLTTGKDFSLSGAGKVNVTTVVMGDLPCTAPGGLGAYPVTVPPTGPVIVLPKPQVALALNLGPARSATYHCSSPTSAVTWNEGKVAPWHDEFTELHAGEQIKDNAYQIKDWEIINQPGVFARKTYQRASRGITERTVLELVPRSR